MDTSITLFFRVSVFPGASIYAWLLRRCTNVCLEGHAGDIFKYVKIIKMLAWKYAFFHRTDAICDQNCPSPWGVKYQRWDLELLESLVLLLPDAVWGSVVNGMFYFNCRLSVVYCKTKRCCTCNINLRVMLKDKCTSHVSRWLFRNSEISGNM